MEIVAGTDNSSITHNGHPDSSSPAISFSIPGVTWIGHLVDSLDYALLLAACDLSESSSNSTTRPPRKLSAPPRPHTTAHLVRSGCVLVWESFERKRGGDWSDGLRWNTTSETNLWDLQRRGLPPRSLRFCVGKKYTRNNDYSSDGLVRHKFQYFTPTGRVLHVLSYTAQADIDAGRLRRPSQDPRFVGSDGCEWAIQLAQTPYARLAPEAGHHTRLVLSKESASRYLSLLAPESNSRTRIVLKIPSLRRTLAPRNSSPLSSAPPSDDDSPGFSKSEAVQLTLNHDPHGGELSFHQQGIDVSQSVGRTALPIAAYSPWGQGVPQGRKRRSSASSWSVASSDWSLSSNRMVAASPTTTQTSQGPQPSPITRCESLDDEGMSEVDSGDGYQEGKG